MSDDKTMNPVSAAPLDEGVYDMGMAINILVAMCHSQSVVAGWWDHLALPLDTRDNLAMNTAGTKLALIHSEISEALEGLRKGLHDDHLPAERMVMVELADAVIRICDLVGAIQERDENFGQILINKLVYNRQRADHTREARAQDGGKKV